MADTFKIKFDERALNKLLQSITDEAKKKLTTSQMNDIGRHVVVKMKDLIRKGVSPIQGNGRFEAYRGSYAMGISRKYARYKALGKKLRPVNLTLTGEMLNNLKHRASGTSIVVGYDENSEIKKEQGHREQANGQAFRPTIPEGKERI